MSKLLKEIQKGIIVMASLKNIYSRLRQKNGKRIYERREERRERAQQQLQQQNAESGRFFMMMY